MSPFIDRQKIEELSIVRYLEQLGFIAKFKAGPEYFYHSLFREDDHTPSFSVNDAKGVWMDRGNADPQKLGGGIIQLARLLKPHLSYYELLNHIQDTCNGLNISSPEGFVPHKRDVSRPEDTLYQYELSYTRPIGSSYQITRYLEDRGLLEVAEGRLSEIYYRNRKFPDGGPYFAAGWQNEYGNWEFSRADGLKSSTGKKGLTIVPGNSAHAQVFEGYFDYLSRLRYDTEGGPQPTVIVMNSVTFASAAVERLRNFAAVDLFCDNDETGRDCTVQLMSQLPQAVDRAYEYQPYKDYNHRLQVELGLNHELERAKRLGR